MWLTSSNIGCSWIEIICQKFICLHHKHIFPIHLSILLITFLSHIHHIRKSATVIIPNNISNNPNTLVVPVNLPICQLSALSIISYTSFNCLKDRHFERNCSRYQHLANTKTFAPLFEMQLDFQLCANHYILKVWGGRKICSIENSKQGFKWVPEKMRRIF